MKYIHFPTLLMHLALLILAAVTINHYHDAFLLISGVILIAHMVWAIRSKKQMAVSYVIGCAVQFAVFYFGLIDVHSGAFGLGGGEFALLFYLLALAVLLVIECIIGLFKRKA